MSSGQYTSAPLCRYCGNPIAEWMSRLQCRHCGAIDPLGHVTNSTVPAPPPMPITSRCPHCGDWLGEHDRDCIKAERGAA